MNKGSGGTGSLFLFSLIPLSLFWGVPLIQGDRTGGHIGEPFRKIAPSGMREPDVPSDFGPVFLVLNASGVVFKQVPDRLLLGIGEFQGEKKSQENFPSFGLFEGEVRGLPVGPGQPAGSEFDASEVAHHNNQDISQGAPVDGFDNGLTCGSGGFAVIVPASQRITAQTKPVPVTDMARVMKAPPEIPETSPGCFVGVDGAGQSYEPGSLDLQFAFGRAAESQVTVGKVIFGR